MAGWNTRQAILQIDNYIVEHNKAALTQWMAERRPTTRRMTNMLKTLKCLGR